MMTPFDAEARVAHGAALLDSNDPRWWEKINRQSLNISSCIRCVLGQVYGTFEEGLEVLTIPNVTRTQQAGFSFQSSTRFYEAEELALRAAWLAEIEKRVEAAAHVESQYGAVAERPLDAILV